MKFIYATAAVVVVGDDFAVTTPYRDHHPAQGHDIFPGGKIDASDALPDTDLDVFDLATQERCTRREAAEETGELIALGALYRIGKITVVGLKPGVTSIVWLFWGEGWAQTEDGTLAQNDECYSRLHPVADWGTLNLLAGDKPWFSRALHGRPFTADIEYHEGTLVRCEVTDGFDED